MKSAESSFIKKNYKISLIEESAQGGSYALIPLKAKKNFVQVLAFELKNDGFVNIQIFVSNLSQTELWSEINIDLEFVSVYLKQMLLIAYQELSKNLTKDAQFEALVTQIEASETKQVVLLDQLAALEKQLEDKKTPDASKPKLIQKWAAVEEKCINEEMQTSKLSYRYFINTIEEVDPFFYSRLFTADWALKKAKKK